MTARTATSIFLGLVFTVPLAIVAMAESPGANSARPLAQVDDVSWLSVTAEQSRSVFERIKNLDGPWTGASTKGWTGDYEIRVIARGSAVLSTMRFTDEPAEGMATVYSMDGADLVLTHYCEAGNQPRLRLAEMDASGEMLHWVFVDGGNLPTRDPGHMDELVMRLAEDSFTSRWSWYSNGVTSWMEDITYQRIKGGGH